MEIKKGQYYECLTELLPSEGSKGFAVGKVYVVLNIRDKTLFFGEYENEQEISIFDTSLSTFETHFKLVELEEEGEETEETQVRGRRGRPRNPVNEATNGQLAAGLQKSIQSVFQAGKLAALKDEEIKERLRQILKRCLDLMEQHFLAMDITTVTYIRTPNGPKKVTMGGFSNEDYMALMGTVELISELLIGKVQMPDKKQDQKLLIKSYLKPLVQKREETSDEQSNDQKSSLPTNLKPSSN